MHVPWRLPAIAALALSFAAGAAQPAAAHATVMIQERGGTMRQYAHASIDIVRHQSLTITSPDGMDSIIIHHAACNFAGELERCLPYDVAVNKHGTTHMLELDRGTVYINRSDAPLPLRHSSSALAPHSIMLTLRTQIGTVISVTGRIDKDTL
jgi:hypothetical protein